MCMQLLITLCFRELLKSGELRGGSFALYHQGELVVEVYGGYADEENRVEWKKQTLGRLFSSTKAFAAVTIAFLVDRGLLNYDERVAKYWPEFAQNGKDQITLRQLISHQAGLAAIDELFSIYDIIERPGKVGDILAKQKPQWNPGSKFGYHGITLGLYLDQIVRRVDPDHRNLAEFFHDEIALPLELDAGIGLPNKEYYRVAKMGKIRLFNLDLFKVSHYWKFIYIYITNQDHWAYKAIINPKEYEDDNLVNNPTFASTPNPSTHGYGTATSAAKLFGILANGGMWNGKKIISANIINKLNIPEVSGEDQCVFFQQTMGLGTKLLKSPQGNYIFGTPGAGGQMVYADPKANLGWAFLNNDCKIYAFGEDPRYKKVEKAIYETLETINNKRD
ncbi:DgyrCDS4203 [Dimorphilus gyrociliatus]|uniref:DgyrCDS4203 n=1 Tax=Dimorphilus gyrociliatus TaxID=2664684 RepID=A0A7I8VG95_9ANNE|nr:DgyrCDS4203 [Dimorphilus gyrociliatus]